MFRWLFDQPYLLLTVAILSWAGNSLMGRAVHAEVPPIGLAFWRWTTALVLIAPFCLPYAIRDWPVIRRHWRILVVLAIPGITAFNTLLYLGLQSTTALNGMLINATMPVAIIAMSFLMYREKVSAPQLLGVISSFAGVMMIVVQGNWQVLRTLSFNPGDIWVVTAVVFYAAYSVLLRKRPPMHPFSFLLATFAFGIVILLPFYIAETLTSRSVPITWSSVGAILYVAVFPSIVAYLFYNRGIELVGPNRASAFFNLLPVFGAGLAILLLGERIHWFHLAGLVMILAGIFLATRRPARAKPNDAVET